MKPSPKLIIFGNPLLDITVQIKDDELLKKYHLEVDGQKEVPLEELGKLIGDAKARYGDRKRKKKKCWINFPFFIDSTNSRARIVHETIKRHSTRAEH